MYIYPYSQNSSSNVPQLNLSNKSAFGTQQTAQLSAPPQLAPTTSNQPSTFQSLVQNVSTIYEGVSSINRLFENVRNSDKASGYGLWSGAQEFAGKVQDYYSLYQNLSSVRSVEDIGKMGQNYVLSGLQNELRDAVGTQIGQAADSLGFKELGEQAYDYVFGTSAASATTTASASGTLSAGAEAGTMTSEGVAAGASKVLGAAGAAYGAYSLVKNWGKSSPMEGAVNGATVGAYVGSIIPGVGTVIGGVVGGVVGGLLGLIKTGKHKDQVARDQMRKQLQQIGLVSDQYQVRLADGTGFDVGKDGGFKLQNLDGTERAPYNTDPSNPLTGDVIALLSPLAEALYPGNEKLRTDLVGYLTNAALSNAQDLQGALSNVRGFYAQVGVSGEQLAQGMTSLAQQGAFDQQTLAVHLGSLQRVFA